MISEVDALRFFSKVEFNPVNGCHEWTSTQVCGYGKFKAQGRQWRAHRLVWHMNYGDPGDLVVRHTCDNKLCVNLDHLKLGTQAENIQDKMDRDRQARGTRVTSSKLCSQAVEEIRAAYASTSHLPGGASYVSLAEHYGVDQSIIGDIVTGKTWREVGGPISKPRPGRRRTR